MSNVAKQEDRDATAITTPSTDVEANEYIHATWFHKSVFVAMGVADLFYWNCVLNILYDIRDKYYPDYPSMTDTLNAVNNVSSLIVCMYTVKTGAMNVNVTIAAGALLSSACLLSAITVQWAPGVTGVVLLHIANVIAGACSGFFQTGSCGLASVIGKGGMVGHFSTGQGITGVLTFAMWMAISHSKLETKAALWTLMAIGAGITLLTSIFFIILVRKPEIRKRVEEVKQALATEANNPDAPSYAYIFRCCWMNYVTIIWNMFVSLVIFPSIGPMGWGEGDFTSYTLGTFQVGDLIGRYTPNLIGALKMSKPVAAGAVILRTGFFPLAVLCWKFQNNGFWGNKAMQMILMALISITNGWVMTSVFINTPISLPQQDWRSRAVNLTLLFCMAGISSGLWVARIFTATWIK